MYFRHSFCFLSPQRGCVPPWRGSPRVGHLQVVCPFFSVLNIIFPLQNFVINKTFWLHSHSKKPIYPPEISDLKHCRKKNTVVKNLVSFSGIFIIRKQVNLLKPFPTLIWVHISSTCQDFCPFLLRLWGEPFWCQRLQCRRGAGWMSAGSSGCHLESKFSLRIRNDLQSVAKLIGQTISKGNAARKAI